MSGLELSKITRESFRSNIDQVNLDAASILSLTLQLKQVENHYTTIGNSIDERFKQLRSVEESIKQSLEELKLREEKLSFEQDAVKQRFEELERKEEEFELMRESGTSQKEIDRIQGFLKELELAKLGFEEGLRKLDLQEKKHLLMAQERFEHQAKLEKRERELEAKEKRFEELVAEYEFSIEFEPQRPFTRSKSRTLHRCDLIQNLIENQRRLQAIKYVCEFNMAHKCSLATLLQDHLRYVKRISRECKDDAVPSQIVGITKEISDLKAVIKCIQLYKLETDFPLGEIEKSLRKREKKKVELEMFGPCTRSKSKILHQPSECRNKRARIG